MNPKRRSTDKVENLAIVFIFRISPAHSSRIQSAEPYHYTFNQLEYTRHKIIQYHFAPGILSPISKPLHASSLKLNHPVQNRCIDKMHPLLTIQSGLSIR